MNSDWILKISSTIIGIITTFIVLFKKNQKVIENYMDTYFNKVLVDYVNKYRNNDNIDAVEYIKNKYSLEESYIPKYIFYLVDKNNACLLHKILIVDYWESHPSKRKNVFKVMCNISDIVEFLSVIVLFVLSIVYAYGILSLIYLFISESFKFKTIDVENIKTAIVFMGVSGISFYLSTKAFKDINDDYSLKNKDIIKVIEKREKDYDKNHTKYYIN